MPAPDGPQWENVDAYDQELINAVTRRLKDPTPLGRGKTRGPLGPLDADLIDRNKQAVRDVSDFGMTPIHVHDRGFSVDMGIPDVNVGVTPYPTGGFAVRVSHLDRYRSNPDGSYAYPEGWGDIKGHLPVEPHQLGSALMDYLAQPQVRHHMTPPK